MGGASRNGFEEAVHEVFACKMWEKGENGERRVVHVCQP